MRSSRSSMPTDSRMRLSVISSASRSSFGTDAWVMLALKTQGMISLEHFYYACNYTLNCNVTVDIVDIQFDSIVIISSQHFSRNVGG